MAYKIVYARGSARTSITGQRGHEGPFSEVYDELSAMVEAFKRLAADAEVTTLGAYGPDGGTISDVELRRLTGYTGRYWPA